MGLSYNEIIKALQKEIKKIKPSEPSEDEPKKRGKKGVQISDEEIKIKAALKKIVCDNEKNKLFRGDEAQLYYFGENGLENIEGKYKLIIDLQYFLTNELNTQFIYDKFTLLRLLQLPLTAYNSIMEQCIDIQSKGIEPIKEDIANIFTEIESLLISDRINSAESGSLDSKAVDNTNRYSKKMGGYGLSVTKPKDDTNNTTNANISNEEVMRKLKNFNFSSKVGATTKKGGK